MPRYLHLVALLIAVGCASDDEPAAPPYQEPEAPAISDLAGLDTLTVDATTQALPDRPRSPVRINDACPFEGCRYGPWTTSDSTAVYAADGDTTSVAFVIPAETALTADGGFVLVTRVGRAVARRDAEVFLGFQDTLPVAGGDTLTVLDYQGEGFSRVWHAGRFASADAGGATPDGDAFETLDEARQQWWAHVSLADGRSGWLWMDRTPPVRGADSLSG